MIAWSVGLLLLSGGEVPAFQIVEAETVATVEADLLRMPTDAAFGSDGSLFVLDGYQNRIVLRRPDGTIKQVRPSGACALNRPLGIACHQGHVYVANTGDGTLCELDEDGTCRRSFVMGAQTPETLRAPTDIAIEGGRVAVADRGLNRILLSVYPSFDPVQEVGDFGKATPPLNSPFLLDWDRGRVFVSDMMNGRLVMLSDRGKFLRALGERGVREGQFIRPKGVTVGHRGHVFVSDSTLGVVQVFNTSFEYVGTVGKKGKPSVFRHPSGMAAQGDLLAVVEQKGNAVALMRIRLP